MSNVPVWISDIGPFAVSISAFLISGAALVLSIIDRARRLKIEEKAHAARISAWQASTKDMKEGDAATFRIRNNSDELISEVVLFWVFIQGAGPGSGEKWMKLLRENSEMRSPYAVFGRIPPGQVEYAFPSAGGGIMNERIDAEISFLDKNGNSWVRRADGELERLPSKPIDHYGIARLLDYQTPIVVS